MTFICFRLHFLAESGADLGFYWAGTTATGAANILGHGGGISTNEGGITPHGDGVEHSKSGKHLRMRRGYPSRRRHDDTGGPQCIFIWRHGTRKGAMIHRTCGMMCDGGIIARVKCVFTIFLLLCLLNRFESSRRSRLATLAIRCDI